MFFHRSAMDPDSCVQNRRGVPGRTGPLSRQGLPFRLFNGASTSAKVLLFGVEAVVVLTLIILKRTSRNHGPNIDPK